MTLLSRTMETPGDSGYKKEEEKVAGRVKTGKESYQGVIPDEVASCVQVGFTNRVASGKQEERESMGNKAKVGYLEELVILVFRNSVGCIDAHL